MEHLLMANQHRRYQN